MDHEAKCRGTRGKRVSRVSTVLADAISEEGKRYEVGVAYINVVIGCGEKCRRGVIIPIFDAAGDCAGSSSTKAFTSNVAMCS